MVCDGVRYVVPNKTVVSEYADNLNIYTRKMFDPFRRENNGAFNVVICYDDRTNELLQMVYRIQIVESDTIIESMALHPETKYSV
jgi:hypothetical protein